MATSRRLPLSVKQIDAEFFANSLKNRNQAGKLFPFEQLFVSSHEKPTQCDALFAPTESFVQPESRLSHFDRPVVNAREPRCEVALADRGTNRLGRHAAGDLESLRRRPSFATLGQSDTDHDTIPQRCRACRTGHNHWACGHRQDLARWSSATLICPMPRVATCPARSETA